MGNQDENQKKVVNGNTVSEQEFQEMQNDSNIRLKKIDENSYKKLEKMNG